MNENDIAAKIAAPFIAALQQGDIPWRMPWLGLCNIRGNHYRGYNRLLLNYKLQKNTTWTEPLFLTFAQALDLGGGVKRGQHGTFVTFWKPLPRARTVTTRGEDGEAREELRITRGRVLRYYTVFNIAQCDLDESTVAKIRAKLVPQGDPGEDFEAIATAAAALVNPYLSRPDAPSFAQRGARAYYSPTDHSVTIPPRTLFGSGKEWASTLFHELIHSTGKALGRPMEGDFGSEGYAKEELVAEIGASMLCGEIGVTPTGKPNENSLAYVQGWVRPLLDKPKAIITAAARAQKAVDYILGRKFEESEESDD